MLNILVACEFSSGRFSKVLSCRLRGNGSGSLAAKWNGSIESYVARTAARFFAANEAAIDVFYEIGSKKYRVTRY